MAKLRFFKKVWIWTLLLLWKELQIHSMKRVDIEKGEELEPSIINLSWSAHNYLCFSSMQNMLTSLQYPPKSSSNLDIRLKSQNLVIYIRSGYGFWMEYLWSTKTSYLPSHSLPPHSHTKYKWVRDRITTIDTFSVCFLLIESNQSRCLCTSWIISVLSF